MLFHVTADTRWSDLPLSGAFVEMLKRIVALAGTSRRRSRRRRASAGRARSRAAEPRARRLRRFRAAARRRHGRCRRISPAAPPPIIRRASTVRRKACSRSTRWSRPTGWRRSISRRSMPARESIATASRSDLRGPIFLAALALLAARRADRAVARRRHRARSCAARGAAHGRAGASALVARRPCSAAPSHRPPRGRRLRHEVDAGDPACLRDHRQRRGRCDQQGRATGLTLFLAQRTALEAGEPIGLDPARDELAFFPLIYWPIVPGAREAVAARRWSASTPT